MTPEAKTADGLMVRPVAKCIKWTWGVFTACPDLKGLDFMQAAIYFDYSADLKISLRAHKKYG
jgi:hypothetical protein